MPPSNAIVGRLVEVIFYEINFNINITSWSWTVPETQNRVMSQDLKNHIGLRVKSARDAKGLTQKRLAELVEKTPETISNLERGSAMTGIETLEGIAHELGVPLSDFVEGYDREREPSRARLDLENRLQQFARNLSDQDLKSAIELIEVIAKRSTG